MKDMTKGSPMNMIVLFAVPMLLGSIFQQFYNLADTRIVGQYLGENALAAVGATSSINTVVLGFMHGLSTGFSLTTARFFGAKDEEKIKQSVAANIVLSSATCLVLTVLSLLLLEPLMRAINVDEQIFEDAKGYISVIMVGMAALLSYNIAASLMRAIGDTVMPLIFLIFSAIVNIGLDILFVRTLMLGIKGAAYATVISSAISAVLCVIYMKVKYPILIPSARHFKFSANLAINMYASGSSVGLMSSMVGIGSLILQGAINDLGRDTIVAHVAARKMSELFMMPMMAFGAAGANFAGQNYGAGRYDRVRKGFKDAVLLTWIWSTVTVIAAFTVTPMFVRAVTATENEYIIGTACRYTHFNMPCYYILGMVFVLRNGLNGIGMKIMPIASGFIELVGKIAVAFLLAPRIGYKGIIISEPITWALMLPALAYGLISNKEMKKSIAQVYKTEKPEKVRLQ